MRTLTSISAVVVLLFAAESFAGDLDVVINEMLYNPPRGLGDAEFIELYNSGGDAVDLDGWFFDGNYTI